LKQVLNNFVCYIWYQNQQMHISVYGSMFYTRIQSNVSYLKLKLIAV